MEGGERGEVFGEREGDGEKVRGNLLKLSKNEKKTEIMKAKNIILFIGIFYFKTASVFACSCEVPFFCDYIKEPTVKVAFLGEVVAHAEYGPYNIAVYFRVLERYKDEAQFTDTVKIYGMEIESGCAINVTGRFPIGDTAAIALGPAWGGMEIVNPDSLMENYWEYYPNLCNFRSLRVHGNKVAGGIAEGIYEYPLHLFGPRLENCGFSQGELLGIKCSTDNFTVFPNPSVDGKIKIKADYLWISIERVRVFGVGGRLVGEYSDLEGRPYREIELTGFVDGINIIEVSCNGKKYYKKVVIEK